MVTVKAHLLVEMRIGKNAHLYEQVRFGIGV